MAATSSSLALKMITGHARDKGWDVYRDSDRRRTSAMLVWPADPPQVMHVTVIPDGRNGVEPLLWHGVIGRIIHVSDVPQFIVDLADIASTRPTA